MYKISRLLLMAAVGLCAYVFFLIFSSAGLWIIALFAILYLKNHGKSLWSHGTARWANADDLRYALDAREGLTLGRMHVKRSFLSLFNPRIPSREACKGVFGYKALIRLPVIHTLVCAPTGAGKGVSFLIVHGLSCLASTVFFDMKGEIARATMKVRKKFGKVFLIDPFNLVAAISDSVNVLDFIEPDSPTSIDDCHGIGQSVVVRTGNEHEMHWLDYAEIVITAITAFVVFFAPRSDRSLQTVAGIISNQEEFLAALEYMKSSGNEMLARMAGQLSYLVDKELASVLTTTLRMLDFLNTPSIAGVTGNSTCNLADLPKRRMSVYVIMPPERLKANAGFMRLMMWAASRAVMSNGLQEKNKVHILVDEAATLGRMEAVEDVLNVGRGYGLRMMLVYQSLGQLKTCWPNGNDQTVLGGTTNVFFGVNDNATGEYISNRLGEHTIIVNSGGRSTNHSRQVSYGNSTGSTSYSVSSSDNWAAHGRRLLKPEEIMALDQKYAITLHAGMPPIFTKLVRYYERGFRNGWFKRAISAMTILLISLAIFLTAAWAVVKVRHDKEVQRARLDAAIVSKNQGSAPRTRAGNQEARCTRMH